jgi:serine/threonine-protein kinase mTOR
LVASHSTGESQLYKHKSKLILIHQIIARIQTPHANIRTNIDHLLIDVGKHHPQALIYPLTVASKSSSASRRNAATAIMERMREHSPLIVSQVRILKLTVII